MACVIFSVDGVRARGIKPVSNEEVAELAAENSRRDDPVREHRSRARRGRRSRGAPLDQHYGVRGFKFHPQFQEFFPNDRAAYPLYEVIAEAELPALFHTGHSGMGTGMPGGGGIRLKYGNPMDVDDVAVDFPTMPIVLAHPSWPWQDEALSICLHKPQVYIDLSGWSPKYFPPQLVQHANTQLKKKNAVRHRLSVDHSGPVARGLREDRHPSRSPPADSQGNAIDLLKLGLEQTLDRGSNFAAMWLARGARRGSTLDTSRAWGWIREQQSAGRADNARTAAAPNGGSRFRSGEIMSVAIAAQPAPSAGVAVLPATTRPALDRRRVGAVGIGCAHSRHRSRDGRRRSRRSLTRAGDVDKAVAAARAAFESGPWSDDVAGGSRGADLAAGGSDRSERGRARRAREPRQR